MPRLGIVLFGVLVAASPLTAQDNPFAFTGGSVKTAYIVYELMDKKGAVQGATWESGVAQDRWILRMVMPVDLGGKKDTMRSLVITTRDSQYKYNSMGSQGSDAEVSPTLRFHLAREYAALDAAGKARFKENLKLGTSDNSSASDDMDAFIMLTGDKVGSETVAGHKCDVYKRKTFTACVIPQAPMVMLKWSDQKQNLNLIAKKVTLNGPVPTVASLRPKAVQWKKGPYDDADFILGIWTFKKQTDPETVPAATLAQFAVKYLASPGASAELKEMSGGGTGGDEETQEDDSNGEDGS